jgi:hypothetical protein
MKRFRLAACLVLAVGIASTWVPPSVAGAAPHRSHFVTGVTLTPLLHGVRAVSPTTGASTKDDWLRLLAGSADRLVFSRSMNADEYDPEFESTYLYAVNSAGDVTPLGLQPSGFGWSIVGDMLTSTPSYNDTAVNWLNLSDNSSGSRSIPIGGHYLGATSAGWAYVLDNQLFTESTSGTVTPLGYPLGNAPGENVTSGGTGPNGALVVDSTSRVAYLRYADPTHPVVLDTVNLAHTGSSQPVYMQCVARTSDAFCGESPNTLPNSYNVGERLSLTGGPAVKVTSGGDGADFDDFAIDDQATATAGFSNFTVTKADGSGGGTETSTMGRFQATSAFNKIVTTNEADTEIETIAAPGDTPSVLVAPKMSPIQADSASQTAGRVVYLDDQVSPSSHPAPYVWSRPVRNMRGAIKLGTPSYIGTLDDGAGTDEPLQAPIASSALTAYLRVSRFDRPPYRFTRPVDPRSWTSGHTDSIVMLSGNRVLNRSRSIVDTTKRKLSPSRPVAQRPDAAALWGNEYCYMKYNGLLKCVGLVSGRHVTLRGPQRGETASSPAAGSVWLYGDHLAWLDARQSNSASLVDLRHPSRRIRLSASLTVVSLTSNGALVVRETHDRAGDATFYMRGYQRSAKPKPLLRATGVYDFVGVFEANVEVDQSVLTWADGNTIMAAPLPHVSDPPRFLGAPVAPKRMRAGKAGAWRAYLPYSASLTRCNVMIRRHHKVLRTLRCVRSDMAYGGVVVSWNGRDKSGEQVVPGKVSWTVHASNADGHAIAGGGLKRPVSGTIKVTH